MTMPEKNLSNWASVADALTSVIPWVHTLILSIVATAAQYAEAVAIRTALLDNIDPNGVHRG